MLMPVENRTGLSSPEKLRLSRCEVRVGYVGFLELGVFGVRLPADVDYRFRVWDLGFRF